MENSEDKSRIEKLKDALYARGGPSILRDKRSIIPKREYDVRSEWKNEESENTMPNQSPRKSHFFRSLFVVSLIFFAASLAVALFVFYQGSNIVSAKNVNISILGPVSVGGGEELSLNVIVSNENNVALDGVNLIIAYPQGTRAIGDLNTELLRATESLGDIPPGQSISKTIKAVLFGEKESVKEISVTVEYRVKGSSALFYKEKKYQISINSAPVIMTISSPSEVSSNQDVQFDVTIASNSNSILKNILLQADFPFGWSMTKAVPSASFGNNVWSLGDLKPGAKRNVKITGKIDAQNEEERTFGFHAGTASDKDEKMIAADFAVESRGVAVKKQSLAVDISLDGNIGKEFVTTMGKNSYAVISLTNNLQTKITDANIAVKLSGDVLDRSSVSVAEGGFYRSVDNTIVWDKNSNQRLAEINPGEKVSLSFSFGPLADTSGIAIKNPQIIMNITAGGTKFVDQSSGEVSTSISRVVKVATSLALSARLIYSNSGNFFTNTGPIPPKAEQETTYTGVWTVTNSSSDVSGTQVTASLPSYVRWLNIINSSQENIYFSTTTNSITWDLGEVKAGSGYTSLPREVAFKVAFLPSLGQVGTAPIIVRESTIIGLDRFTGLDFQSTRASLTTKLSSDPSFRDGQENVVK